MPKDKLLEVTILGQKVSDTLTKLEPWFGPNYTLTFIARCTKDVPDTDIVLTKDDLHEVIKVIEEIVTR